MTRMTGGQALVRSLEAHGVDTVFGLMSDDTAVFAVTLDTIGIGFYGARHENAAISMAEGYAAATGRLGVALVGRGPATANGLHAAVYASRTGSRVLIMYGEAPVTGGGVNTIGPDYKSFNGVGVLASAGLKTFVANSPGAARGALAHGDPVLGRDLGHAVDDPVCLVLTVRYDLGGAGSTGTPLVCSAPALSD